VIEAIVARLLEHGGVSGLVGDRVSPAPLKAPTLPAISYEAQVSRVVSARSLSADVQLRTRVQVDCWALTVAQVEDLAAQVFDALESWKGTLAGVEIKGVFLDSSGGNYEAGLLPNQPMRRVRADYFVVH
jgi:hypothetical protein